MTRLDRTLANTLASYVRQGLSLCVVFVTTPLIVRQLGVGGFGLWSLAFSIVGVIGLLDLGLLTATTKFVADAEGRRDAYRRNQMISTLLALYIGLAIVSVGVLWLTTRFVVPALGIESTKQPELIALLWILGVRVAAAGLPLGLFKGILFGQQKIVLVSLIQGTSALLYGLGVWLVLAGGGGLITLAWLNLAVMVLENTAFAGACLATTPGLRISSRLVDRRLVGEVTRFCSSQVVVNASALIRLRADPIVVKAFMPLSAVGVYTIGLRAAEGLHLFVKQGVNVLAPVLAQLAGEGHAAGIRRVIVVSGKYAFGGAIALTALSTQLAADAVTLWVGPGFEQAAMVLTVLLFATAIGTLEGTAGTALAMTGHHAPASAIAAVGAVANVLLSLLMIRQFGLLGVAAATVLATALVDSLTIGVLLERAYGIGWRSYISRTVLPSALPVGACLIATSVAQTIVPTQSAPGLLVAAIAGVVTFASSFLAFSATREERIAISGLFRRRLAAVWGQPKFLGERT